MALVATSLGVDATAFRQHLDGWLDGKRVATSRSWRAVEDAQLIATLLWPPNTPPAMVPGRKDREAVRRRGELSFDVGISKWKLLLQPHELKAISDWLRQWRGHGRMPWVNQSFIYLPMEGFRIVFRSSSLQLCPSLMEVEEEVVVEKVRVLEV